MPLPITALLAASTFLAGCTGNTAEGDFVVDATVDDDIQTVVDLSWSTGDAGTSWVAYGLDSSLDLVTPTTETASTDHEFQLYGLPPASTIHYAAHTLTDAGELVTEGTIETGMLPADLPEFTVDTWQQGSSSTHPYALVLTMDTESRLMVLDREGRRLWYRLLGTENAPIQELHTDILFGYDGEILVMEFSTDLDDYRGEILSLDFSGRAADSIPLQLGHHGFTQLADGTIAYLAADEREWRDPETGEVFSVVGDAVREVAPDGSDSVLFTSWDWASPTRHPHWDTRFWTGAKDWTHGNSIHYREDTGAYTISLAMAATILDLDRETGNLVREIAEKGYVTFGEDTRVFKLQHDAQWTDEGTLLMASELEDTAESGVLEYVLSEGGTTLEETWSYGEGEGLFSFAEGKVHRLENGNTLATWCTAGTTREISPEGEVVWELSADVGTSINEVVFFHDFYEPPPPR